MSKVTKKLYLETIARIEARNAEPINPVTLDLNFDPYNQPVEWRNLLNPANIILPEQPVMSDLAKAWQETYDQWRTAWNNNIWREVQRVDYWKLTSLENDHQPVSVTKAGVALNKVGKGIEDAIDSANRLTHELAQLEQAGARAEFEDFQSKSQRYHWHFKSRVEGLQATVERDQQTVEQYEWQLKSKALNLDALHQEAIHEDWNRRFYPELFVTASA